MKIMKFNTWAMSEIESDDCEEATCDPHQDRRTQCTLARDNPVRKIRAKTYKDSTRGRGKQRRREISEEDATTHHHQTATWRILLTHTMVHTGHSARRDAIPSAPSRDAIRSVEVNCTDPTVPRWGRVKATAPMTRTATEATARDVTLNLLFESKKIRNVNISETVWASANMHGTTSVDFDIFHRMTTLRKLYSVTLTYFLGKKFEMLISRTVRAHAKKVK